MWHTRFRLWVFFLYARLLDDLGSEVVLNFVRVERSPTEAGSSPFFYCLSPIGWPFAAKEPVKQDVDVVCFSTWLCPRNLEAFADGLRSSPF